MTVQHHPDDTLLLGYASGRLDGAMSLVIATHLSFCAYCRKEVLRAERVGGVLLDQIEPVPLAAGALEKTLARLGERIEQGTEVPSNDNTPMPLRAFMGRDLSQIRWRRIGSRLGYFTLYRRGPLAVRLLRGAPGSHVGQHTHRGLEYTLVLRGGFTDTTGNYGPGDFQAASENLQHNPVADTGGDCINLAVTTGSLRFEGLVRGIVGRLLGF